MHEFEKYLRNIGKSVKTARNYAGAISGPISRWALDNKLAGHELSEFEEVLEFEKVAAGIRQLEIYSERNSVGKGMYNAAINAFSQFLADQRGIELDKDLEAIISDSTIDQTEKNC